MSPSVHVFDSAEADLLKYPLRQVISCERGTNRHQTCERHVGV